MARHRPPRTPYASLLRADNQRMLVSSPSWRWRCSASAMRWCGLSLDLRRSASTCPLGRRAGTVGATSFDAANAGRPDAHDHRRVRRQRPRTLGVQARASDRRPSQPAGHGDVRVPTRAEPDMSAQAIPGYAPLQGGARFSSLQCFWFQAGTRSPGEAGGGQLCSSSKLPRRRCAITLSYTFFEVGGRVPAARHRTRRCERNDDGAQRRFAGAAANTAVSFLRDDTGRSRGRSSACASRPTTTAT